MSFLKQLLGDRRSLLVLGGVAATSSLAWCAFRKWYFDCKTATKFIPSDWEEVGQVSELTIYPVKSAKGIAASSADATTQGLRCGNLQDRSFIIITEDGHMVTGRNAHQLVTMVTLFEDDTLTITSPTNESVAVNISIINKNKEVTRFKIRGDQVQGFDCGDEAADWLSKRLYENATKVRLIYCGSDDWQRPKRTISYFNFPSYRCNDTTLYGDVASYMVMSQSSLEDLNGRLSKPVTKEFFRPPIMISGAAAYDEDTWEYIKIADAVFRMSKPCERCILTTVDPDSGTIRQDHMKELLRYRVVKHPPELAKQWKNEPIFGLHCGIDITGKIKVGDKVYVYRTGSPYWHV